MSLAGSTAAFNSAPLLAPRAVARMPQLSMAEAAPEAAPAEADTEEAAPPPPPAPEYSEALPFLTRRASLGPKGALVGDVGFDPLGFTEILPIVRALTCLCQHQSCIPPRILWPRLSRRSS